MSLAELACQAATVNIDEVPVQIETLRHDISEILYPEIKFLSNAFCEQSARLAAMEGGARAAELSEAMERELALLRRLTDRYTLVKLAARILQQAIDRYREEHQDPVLKIAAGYFKRLTLGSFAGLRADVGDAGQAVLVGVRENGSRLTVEKMSSGTRDQMFLALCLATLQILAELGEKKQVILITHHRCIVEEARQLAGQEGTVLIHELAS